MTTVTAIIDVVANHYHVSERALTGKARHARFVLPRHVAIYLSRELTDYRLSRIARIFGRDHSTAIYACWRIKNDMERDDELFLTVRKLRTRLESASNPARTGAESTADTRPSVGRAAFLREQKREGMK